LYKCGGYVPIPEEKLRWFWGYFIVGRRGLGILPGGSCPWRVTSSGIEATTGALTRLRRLSVVECLSASATAHAPGAGGIQLYGGPYGWVRVGFGFGSALLSFSLRQILSVRRNLGAADGLDIIRRCWQCWDGSGPVEKEGDKGTGESVRRGGGNESAEELASEVRGARGDGSDSGGGRVSGTVTTKLN
jgi:hypothetical protein